MKGFVIVLYIVGTILTCAGVHYATIPQELKQLIPKPNGDNAFAIFNTRDVEDPTNDPSHFILPIGNIFWEVVTNCPVQCPMELLPKLLPSLTIFNSSFNLKHTETTLSL